MVVFSLDSNGDGELDQGEIEALFQQEVKSCL